MINKFGKNRSVEPWYTTIPLVYTGHIHPNKPSKELTIMGYMGKEKYVASWYNDKTGRFGIEFLVDATEDGFIYKDKEIKFTKYGWVI